MSARKSHLAIDQMQAQRRATEAERYQWLQDGYARAFARMRPGTRHSPPPPSLAQMPG